MKPEDKKNKKNGILSKLYAVLFKSNDSAQRISLGFGLGVFLGVFPGTGPAAALLLALVFRLNKASALAGSLLTNTWISIVALILATKTGSAILGIDWHTVRNQIIAHIATYGWIGILKTSYFKVLLAVLLGYIVLGLCMGIIAYLFALLAIKKLKKNSPKGETHP
jgi:uncharacterized protein (DUF2062 family)